MPTTAVAYEDLERHIQLLLDKVQLCERNPDRLRTCVLEEQAFGHIAGSREIWQAWQASLDHRSADCRNLTARLDETAARLRRGVDDFIRTDDEQADRILRRRQP